MIGVGCQVLVLTCHLTPDSRHLPMYFIYSIFLSFAFIALLPYFLCQAFSNQKYLSNFSERLGKLPESFLENVCPTIWIHAVSVGETIAAQTLVKSLRERFPRHRFVFSTTTATGQAVARSRITEADAFCYFPFDWKFSVRKSLRVIRPSIVILMESELWPNFLHECKKQKIPVIVANGRVSDRSFKRSMKFAFWFRKMTANVTTFLMQSEADARRILALGAQSENVIVTGNIKYDIKGRIGVPPVLTSLSSDLALNETPLIIAGSTTDGEEEIILAAYLELKKKAGLENTRLMIAPRHPERFDAVAKLLDSAHLKFVRRSVLAHQVEAIGNQNFTQFVNDSIQKSEVILLDSIGELASLYRFASVVFVGGSLVPKGGHNILEPAFDGRPVIVGPYMENFREITEEFKRRDAVLQLQGANDNELSAALCEAMSELLLSPEDAENLGTKAREAVEANRGATAKTLEVITSLI